jgi:hypothetical protein
MGWRETEQGTRVPRERVSGRKRWPRRVSPEQNTLPLVSMLTLAFRHVLRAPLPLPWLRPSSRSLTHRVNKVFASVEEAVADIPNNATL